MSNELPPGWAKPPLGEIAEIKPLDQGGIPLIQPLIHVGDERLRDVIAWLEQEQKKGRPGK